MCIAFATLTPPLVFCLARQFTFPFHAVSIYPFTPLGQTDKLFLDTTLAQAHLCGMVLPENLPRRNYELWFGLYDPAKPGAPRVLTTDGQDRVLIGRFVMGGS